MSEGKAPKRFPLGLEQVKGMATGTSTGGPAGRDLLRPQLHLHQAAVDAARLGAPSGLGLDSAGVRQRMVDRLRREGLVNDAVCQALSAVPRHEFVDTALAIQAYEDTSLPIGHGQTISKPSVVGRMCEMLLAGENAARQGHLGRVLEIGTGCGYQAAVLAALGRSVVSIERLKPLHDKARLNLGKLHLRGVRLIYGDGCLGYMPGAPFDSIIAAAGGDDIPAAWLAQLAPGGRLVAPMTAPSGRGQVLVVVDHHCDAQGSRFLRSLHESVLFVPLKSGIL